MNKTFFETIKVIDGVHYNIDYHQARYESVLKFYGVKDFLNLASLFDAPKIGFYRCRIVYTLDALQSIEYIKYTKREVDSLKLVYADINYQHKSTSRDALDALYAKRNTSDDVLIVQNNLITDTSIANIALLKKGVWYTPKKVLLEGTTRARYLQEGKIILKDINVEDLESYESVALLNSMIDFDIISVNKGAFFDK